MADTSASLLDRLRLAPDDEAWGRLVEIYSPLIRAWRPSSSASRSRARSSSTTSIVGL